MREKDRGVEREGEIGRGIKKGMERERNRE